MNAQVYTFPPHPAYKTAFGIVKTLTGTYVCPGWYPVPEGTTREQIKFDTSAIIEKPVEEKVETQPNRWEVPGSKPGVMYTVMRNHENHFNCSCPAFSFRRGDCKHILGIKASLK